MSNPKKDGKRNKANPPFQGRIRIYILNGWELAIMYAFSHLCTRYVLFLYFFHNNHLHHARLVHPYLCSVHMYQT